MKEDDHYSWKEMYALMGCEPTFNKPYDNNGSIVSQDSDDNLSC